MQIAAFAVGPGDSLRMRRQSLSILAGLVLSFCLSVPAFAGPREDAVAAFRRADYAAAMSLFRPLAEKGDATAQAYVGIMYYGGLGSPQDNAQAVSWLTKAADQGLAVAQVELGQIYLGGGLLRDLPTAKNWFRKAAEQDGAEGSAQAQLLLGRITAADASTPADDAEAAKWLKKAAESLQKAATSGDLDAKLSLASMYDHGEGVGRDEARAKTLHLEVEAAYRAAAEQGSSSAQIKLARLYRLDQPHQRLQAAIWYRRAADQGDAQAQVELGRLYLQSAISDFVRRLPGSTEPTAPAGPFDPSSDDKIQGNVWFSLALSTLPPHEAAQLARTRDFYRNRMTIEERSEADRLIRDWRPLKETPRPDGAPIRMTPAQQAEVDRLKQEWEPSPAEIEAIQTHAKSYDMTMGSPTAKVTVIEYASASCPHCARFNNEVFPAVKAKYVDTGIVRFVYRDFITPPEPFAVQGALLARCAGPDQFFSALGAIFRDQEAIYDAYNRDRDTAAIHRGLVETAKSVGLSEADFEHCISDRAASQELDARVQAFMAFDRITGAPTFLIGDQKLDGEQSLAQLDAAIAHALDPSKPLANAEKPSIGVNPRAAPGFSIRVVAWHAGDDLKEAPPAKGDERLPQADGGDLWLRPGAVVTGDMIADAAVDVDSEGQPAISFRLTDEGRRRFADYTAANVGGQFANVWNGRIVSAPFIRMPITGGRGLITGGFTTDSAQSMVDAMLKLRR